MKFFFFHLLTLLLISQAIEAKGFKKQEKFDYEEELKVAIGAIKTGGALLIKYWHQGIEEDSKKILETVKGEVEGVVREALLAHFPHATFWGEEVGEFAWAICPLDGEESFLKSNQDFGLQLALLHNGIPKIGVIYYPVKKLLYFAGINFGSYKQVKNRPFRPIQVAPYQRGVLPVTMQKKSESNFPLTLLSHGVENKVKSSETRVVGCCSLALSLIAEGKRSVMRVSEEEIPLTLLAASYVIVQEAGGFLSDLSGEPLLFNQKSQLTNGLLCCSCKELFLKIVNLNFEDNKD